MWRRLHCPDEPLQTAGDHRICEGGSGQIPAAGGETAEAGGSGVERAVRPDRAFKEDARMKLKTMGRDGISINRDTIDVRYVEQLADTEQLAALAYFLKYAEIHVFNGKRTLRESVSLLMQYVEEHGLAAVTESSYVPCGLAMPRSRRFFMHQPLQKNQFVGKGTGERE